MKVGKKYEVLQSVKRGCKKKMIGTIIKEYPKFYVLQTMNYKTCINKSGIISNQYDITAI
ncbi:hypothetical protein [Senegalia massiliensis]|uniref:Uncharacterized protein n=1 Tax=Senegalia massiliensis TaxID=1720316 RepID=A0A845QUW4_9CLOT|nr:hypothetical protein [Senegalia massiliensis]NBI06687.1 hypothetical protein [Senegalia massiliensis]